MKSTEWRKLAARTLEAAEQIETTAGAHAEGLDLLIHGLESARDETVRTLAAIGDEVVTEDHRMTRTILKKVNERAKAGDLALAKDMLDALALTLVALEAIRDRKAPPRSARDALLFAAAKLGLEVEEKTRGGGLG